MTTEAAPNPHLEDFESLRGALTRAARGPVEDFARLLATAFTHTRAEVRRLEKLVERLEKCDLALLAQVTAQRLETLEARATALEDRLAAHSQPSTEPPVSW
jgi:hypothetical protein